VLKVQWSKQISVDEMDDAGGLVIPASSAPIERVFSLSGYISCGRRNRLNDKNLKREVLVKKNIFNCIWLNTCTLK